jgi:nitroreductase
MGTAAEYAAGAASARRPFSGDRALREVVRYATLAASSHNTQPWRFRLAANSIAILPDFARRTPVVDPDDHHLCASLGCAAENLALVANASGLRGEPRFEPSGDGAVVFDFAAGPAAPSALLEAIPRRQSTRADYSGEALAAADLAALEAAAKLDGVTTLLITDRLQRGRVRDLVIAGNSAQVADPAFVAELKHWLRFNPRAALRSGDGIYSGASGNPNLPDWLGPAMFDLTFTAASENDRYARQLDSSAGIAVFVGDRADRDHWIRVGRACQRFALQATALGVRHAFVNQPVEVERMRPELAALVGMRGRRPDLVIRFGYGPALPMSLRRPIEAVIV